MKKIFAIVAGLVSFISISNIALAYTGDIAINENDITFSTNNLTEGGKVRIYATATNKSNQDLLGVVKFYDSKGQIGGDQVISLFAKKTDGVFIDWYPPFGEQTISAKILPWNAKIDDPVDNTISTKVYVAQDTDRDGIPNDKDPDDDNDNVPDEKDAFPLNLKESKDTDGDGVGDNADLDMDNDGVPNEFDDLPLDANETIDTDHDGIGNIADTDDDNDGVLDSKEEKIGTNPLKADTDGDSIIDGKDAFPLDPKESIDTDKDKIGNNTDTDRDNDGIINTQDKFPLNKAPVIKLKNRKTTVDLFSTQTFDATPSTDEDGNIVNYKWEVDGKEVKEGNALTETFETVGEHNVKLTTTDNSGESVSQNFTVSVLNIGLYKDLGLAIATILLALVIYFKYIAEAKDRKDQENQENKLNL